jgi:hypothetical protein
MKLLKDTTYKSMVDELEALRRETALQKEAADLLKEKPILIDGRKEVITPGASSSQDLPLNTFAYIQKSLNVVKPDYGFEVVPIIRKLCQVNPDFSQAMNDFARLANTGHKIKFNPEVSPSQIDDMRQFIQESSQSWHVGSSGINGMVNKFFRQGMIGGAVSAEWIPNANLNDIEEVRYINPEMIRFVVEKNSKGFKPYQKLKHNVVFNIAREMKKLNTTQYKYIALNGDTNLPYGIPPYMAALDAIPVQKNMQENIKFIVDYLGAFGFTEGKIAKPPQEPGENNDQYRARLNQFLVEYKDRMMKSVRNGVMVGYMEESEIQFNATSKDSRGFIDLWNSNENLIASGLGFDPIFMGRPGATETLVTVMFTKMLSQLKNTQDIVRSMLEFGYRLALTLRGFKFKNLTVEFNRSTITDDLKFQQAQEILIRNLVVKFHYGIIGLEQFADELGYLSPDQKKPRIDINAADPSTGEVKRVNREKEKDKSAKKSRDKSKPQGTTRKQNSDDESRSISIDAD